MPGSRIDKFPICQRIRPVKADAQKDCRNDLSAAGHVVPSPDGVSPYDLAGHATGLSIRGFAENEHYGIGSIAAPEILGAVKADTVRIDFVDWHGLDVRPQENATALNAEADERCENDVLPDRRVS